MKLIKNQDIIQSIASALQFISYYHPQDFIKAMYQAYQRETGTAAKNAIGQILINSKMSALGKRPICQDTGLVVIYAQVGMEVKFEGDLSLQQMADAGTRLAYNSSSNPLRASMVAPPIGLRTNTLDNTPAVLHVEIVPGDKLSLSVAAKGGGSENKARFGILNPADDVVEWVVKQIKTLGAGWCPPGIIGLGIGGSPEKALLMAKLALLEPINIDELKNKPELNENDSLRLEIFHQINQLGIGAQGLGGKTTVLDVNLKTYPTHAASLPIALIPNCAATRHIHFCLDGSGQVNLVPPNIDDYPTIKPTEKQPRRIQVSDQNSLRELKSGETVLLSGKILTARDAAHKKIQEIINNGEQLSDYGINLANRMVYYVGPVAPIDGEVVGPAGPTTSGRMDRYTELMLEKVKIAGMIGKSERNQNTVDLIKKHRSIYFIAVGGAAFLIAKSIKASKIIAFPELGMEAIYEFEILDMPVTVAVDSLGNSIHQSGPEKFRISMGQPA